MERFVLIIFVVVVSCFVVEKEVKKIMKLCVGGGEKSRGGVGERKNDQNILYGKKL